MDTERGFKLALLATATLLTILLLLPYMVMILAAILLAYLLSTPYDWLEPKIGERPAAFSLICGTLLVVLLPVVLLLNVVLEGVRELLGVLQQGNGQASVEEMTALLESVFGIDINGASSLLELVRQGDVVELSQNALATFGSISEAFVNLTILLFVWYYLLKDGDRLLAWLEAVSPLSSDVHSTLRTRADELLYAVVIGNFIVAVADGLLVSVGLWATGFSDIIFWAFIAVFLALIPLVGTMLIWVPAAVYLLVTGEVPLGIFLFLWGFLVVGSVDNILRPFLGAPEAGLEPPIFVVGVLTGLSLFGVVGIFFGPILLAMTKALYETLGPDIQ